ncbi:MAG: hypothetical protein HY088_00350 [Ignavibacteriales bacterium]|nr:hypothetical protein [Ignavibacteriales bacterium]
MKKALSILFACSILCYGLVAAQSREEMQVKRAAKGKEVVSQDELVSFKSDMLYTQVLQALSEMSKKFAKKPIIDPSPLNASINQNIESMYWKDAMELILRTNNRWYTEAPDYFQVTAMDGGGGTPGPGGTTVAKVDSAAILAKAREVTISAIFLEIDRTKLNESGISFNIFRGKDLNLGVEFQGSSKVSSNLFGVTANPTSNKLAVSVDAALKVFESEALGEIIARPQVAVRSGSFGRVQIGADFSVKERDFSGNILDKFYSTGTILEVTPKVYQYGSTEFIDLSVSVERSDVIPGSVSTIINKTKASSKLVLLNGEESYVGGLFVNQQDVTREGIPLLKDLPWWVFGLRYIFGYEATKITKKELIVLMKAELVPLLDERVNQSKNPRDVLQQKLQEGRDDMQRRATKKQ